VPKIRLRRPDIADDDNTLKHDKQEKAAAALQGSAAK
jgi:hypothetical protein